MVYKAYKLDRSINQEVISETCNVKNKVELREAILSSPRLQEFTRVQYEGIEYCKHRIENEDNATTVKIYCAIENVLYAMIKK